MSFRTNDDPVDLTKLSLEERRAHRQANLQEISANNTKMEKILEKMSEKNYRVDDDPARPLDGHFEINKKMYKGALLGGFGVGSLAAIISAFILGPIGVLVIFFVGGVIGAISGALVTKTEK